MTYRHAGILLLAGSIFVLSVSTGFGAGRDDTKPEGFQGSRFRLDVFGGLAMVGASNLNALVDYDNRVQALLYDDYLNSLLSADTINSWNKSQNQERPKVKTAWPAGIRASYAVSRRISISLEFQGMWRSHSADLQIQYDRRGGDRTYDLETVEHEPYLLSVSALAPLLGIRLRQPIADRLGLEAFLAAGPIFARCRHLSQWSYDWVTNEEGYGTYTVYTESGVLEEKGTGTGIALDAGGRVDYGLMGRLSLFLESGYALRSVSKISGPGREVRNDGTLEWDGRWAMKKDRITTAWGQLEADYPTSYWPAGSEAVRAGDFKLDLSGFYLRLGVSIRL